MKLVFDGFFESILAAEPIGKFDPDGQINGFLRLIASYLWWLIDGPYFFADMFLT